MKSPSVPVSALVSALLLLTGCHTSTPSRLELRGAVRVNEDLVVLEDTTGRVIAVRNSGERVWAVHPAPSQPTLWDPEPRTQSLCPLVATARGDLILRYPEQLVSITKDGVLRWSRSAPRPWTRAENLQVCPAPTPDSGIVLLAKKGRGVLKLNELGQGEFLISLDESGVALAPPSVDPDSGDILIRTRRHLVNINPAGVMNWRIELD